MSLTTLGFQILCPKGHTEFLISLGFTGARFVDLILSIGTEKLILASSGEKHPFDFLIQHTFLYKNTPSNLLASTT